jgi:hypothetical protein
MTSQYSVSKNFSRLSFSTAFLNGSAGVKKRFADLTPRMELRTSNLPPHDFLEMSCVLSVDVHGTCSMFFHVYFSNDVNGAFVADTDRSSVAGRH